MLNASDKESGGIAMVALFVNWADARVCCSFALLRAASACPSAALLAMAESVALEATTCAMKCTVLLSFSTLFQMILAVHSGQRGVQMLGTNFFIAAYDLSY